MGEAVENPRAAVEQAVFSKRGELSPGSGG